MVSSTALLIPIRKINNDLFFLNERGSFGLVSFSNTPTTKKRSNKTWTQMKKSGIPSVGDAGCGYLLKFKRRCFRCDRGPFKVV